MIHRTILLIFLSFSVLSLGYAQAPKGPNCEPLPAASNCKVLEDFESAAPGTPPKNWKVSKELVPLEQKISPEQNLYVREEEGNQFARIYTENRAFRVVRSRKQGLSWDLQKRPYLRWSWRAKALPEGANEKHSSKNDTGGAIYVTFDTDWLGRPKSIKYTYSSSLPVGTTVDYGPLQVLVVASKKEQGLDKWITHERNVVKDYERLFGGEPDNTPFVLTIWSDTNTLEGVAKVDFNDILLLSQSSAD